MSILSLEPGQLVDCPGSAVRHALEVEDEMSPGRLLRVPPVIGMGRGAIGAASTEKLRGTRPLGRGSEPATLGGIGFHPRPLRRRDTPRLAD